MTPAGIANLVLRNMAADQVRASRALVAQAPIADELDPPELAGSLRSASTLLALLVSRVSIRSVHGSEFFVLDETCAVDEGREAVSVLARDERGAEYLVEVSPV
jgi:hypothetical protein